MVGKTRAIVLHKTNYSESSIVVQVFSFEYGKISLLVQGAKRKKSNHKIALFEPLSILELVANFAHPEKLIRTKEIKLHTPFIKIPSSVAKRSIVMFLSEVLQKCIREPHPEREMFLFIENMLNYLEVTSSKVANFHLIFMMQLTKYLGFHPQQTAGNYFDMEEGVFTNVQPEGKKYLTNQQKDLFYLLLGVSTDKMENLHFTSEERKMVLESLLEYYEVHVSGFKDMKSHVVLEAIFG